MQHSCFSFLFNEKKAFRMTHVEAVKFQLFGGEHFIMYFYKYFMYL